MAIATSLAEPDIRIYSVLLCKCCRPNTRQGRDAVVSESRCSICNLPPWARHTHQPLDLLVRSSAPYPLPSQFDSSFLELFIRHELDRTVRDANEGQSHALRHAPEPFFPREGRQAVYAIEAVVPVSSRAADTSPIGSKRDKGKMLLTPDATICSFLRSVRCKHPGLDDPDRIRYESRNHACVSNFGVTI